MVSKRHFLWIFSSVLLAASGCQQDAENVENALTCEPGLDICGQSCCAYTCVDDVCVNTKTDNNNCGEAGRVCTGSQVCTNGECLSPEEACGTNQTWCKGDCVNIQSDVNNCGGCGITCEENESCKDGSCFAGCSNGYTLCDGQCIDTKRDIEHCGGCAPENACVANQICLDGNCVCPRGYYDCDGDISNGCESTTLCEYLCEDTEKVCGPGLCCDKEETCCGSGCCPANTMCCGDGVCADVINDAKNCGNCGITCEANEKCQNGICVDNSNAQCEANPETGEIPEGDIICWNECVHSLTDNANCGACGNVCDEGYACETGNCVKQCASADETACGDTCYNLNTDTQNCGTCGNICPTNQVCTDGACADSTVTCEDAAQTVCWGVCKDLQNDTANCGACGNVCDEGLSCVDGSCKLVCAKETEMVCNGVCVDVVSNPKACSDCGIPCATTQICVEGGCVDPENPVECGETMTNCWNACVDITSDTQNCGGCGIVCGDTQTCTDGVCTDIVEDPDPNACDAPNLVCYGVCTDVMNDDKNCGACLNACGNGEKCENGVCEIQCGELTKCGAACVDTHNSSNHCGSCGVACKDGESCIGGNCQCAPGRYDCDGIAFNGCESTRTCTCTPGTTQDCWLGQADNRNTGICKDGTQVCDNSGQFWGQCTGGTYPSAITCHDAGLYIGGDQNCNGIDDTTEECVTSCDLRLTDSSYIGCNYWAAFLQNYSGYSYVYMDMTLVISNPSATETADVYVWDKASYTSSSISSIKPYLQMSIPPLSVAYKTIVGTTSGNNTSNAQKSGTTIYNYMMYNSMLAPRAFNVRSSLPVVVYQFNPYGKSQGYTADASLLIPVNALGNDYSTVSYYADSSQDTATATINILAVEPGETKITVTPKISIKAGTDGSSSDGQSGTQVFTAISANTPRDFTLKPFDALSLSANSGGEMTGSTIKANKKIVVFGGSSCLSIRSACDHVEEQIFPTQAWGKSYDVVRASNIGSELDDYYILAQQDSTKVTISGNYGASGSFNVSLPALNGGTSNGTLTQITTSNKFTGSVTLNAGQFTKISTAKNFSVSADKPILVTQFIDDVSGIGDPAQITLVPREQYRADYSFSIPENYQYDYVTLVAPKGAKIYYTGSGYFTNSNHSQPQISCNGVLVNNLPSYAFSGWKTFDANYDYGYLMLDKGTHRLIGDVSFGAIGYGFGDARSTTDDTSYGYPIGLDLKRINNTN